MINLVHQLAKCVYRHMYQSYVPWSSGKTEGLSLISEQLGLEQLQICFQRRIWLLTTHLPELSQQRLLADFLWPVRIVRDRRYDKRKRPNDKAVIETLK